jgi:hypothetical protein
MIKGFIKIFLFLSSYIPLFIILGIKNFSNILFVYIDGGIILISIMFLIYVLFKSSRMNGEYKEITNVQDNSNKFIEYILAYIIPFLGFNLSAFVDVISVSIIFVMVGVLYIRSDLIYMNPMLNLFGYNLYKVNFENKEFMIITKKEVVENQKIKIFKIAKRVGVAK